MKLLTNTEVWKHPTAASLLPSPEDGYSKNLTQSSPLIPSLPHCSLLLQGQKLIAKTMMLSTKAHCLDTGFFPHILVSANSPPLYYCFRWLKNRNRCCISIKQLRGNASLKVNLWYKCNRKKVCLKAIYKNFFCKFDKQFSFLRGNPASRFDLFWPPTFLHPLAIFSIAEIFRIQSYQVKQFQTWTFTYNPASLETC